MEILGNESWCDSDETSQGDSSSCQAHAVHEFAAVLSEVCALSKETATESFIEPAAEYGHEDVWLGAMRQ
eukprot:2662284-Amphidinium_carterae.1